VTAITPVLAASEYVGDAECRAEVSMKASFLTALTLLPLLGGCASTITAVANMPITSDHIVGEGEKLKSMSGDRRLVRVSPIVSRSRNGEILYDENGKPRIDYRICAETQADAISARSASTKIDVTGRGAVADSTSEQLLLTYARTQTSDVIRQLSWQLCNAWVNRVLDPDEYKEQLVSLQAGALAILAGIPPPSNSQPRTSPTPGDRTSPPATAPQSSTAPPSTPP
jgi:hypothetical protein